MNRCPLHQLGEMDELGEREVRGTDRYRGQGPVGIGGEFVAGRSQVVEPDRHRQLWLQPTGGFLQCRRFRGEAHGMEHGDATGRGRGSAQSLEIVLRRVRR